MTTITNRNSSTRSRWFRAAALVAGLCLMSAAALAQPPGGPRRGGGAGFPGLGAGPGARWMALALDLTDAQKQQIQDIVKQSMEANRSLREQLKQIHEQERAAIQAGKSEAELQAISAAAAPLLGQLHTARVLTGAKIYQVLTPAQRDKLTRLRSQTRDRVGPHFRGRALR